MELVDKPIQGKFDLKHLQSIHKYIFQDVYEWAGKIRKVDIAKGKEMSVRLAYYFSEINALHPFREGNGRCQREFIRTLALHARYVINFANVGREEMLKASEDSFLCDYRRMEQLFFQCIRKKN